jgi:hypothetical protein
VGLGLGRGQSAGQRTGGVDQPDHAVLGLELGLSTSVSSRYRRFTEVTGPVGAMVQWPFSSVPSMNAVLTAGALSRAPAVAAQLP